MASGDLTASTPTVCVGTTEVTAAINALNLAATTDFLVVTPIEGTNNGYLVFKVARTA